MERRRGVVDLVLEHLDEVSKVVLGEDRALVLDHLLLERLDVGVGEIEQCVAPEAEHEVDQLLLLRVVVELAAEDVDGFFNPRLELLFGEALDLGGAIDVHVLNSACGQPRPLLEAAPAAAKVSGTIARLLFVDVHGVRRADQKVLAHCGVDTQARDRTGERVLAELRHRHVVDPDEELRLVDVEVGAQLLCGLDDDRVVHVVWVGVVEAEPLVRHEQTAVGARELTRALPGVEDLKEAFVATELVRLKLAKRLERGERRNTERIEARLNIHECPVDLLLVLLMELLCSQDGCAVALDYVANEEYEANDERHPNHCTEHLNDHDCRVIRRRILHVLDPGACHVMSDACRVEPAAVRNDGVLIRCQLVGVCE
mmetsp:Transcript_34482/g.86656  ORF Transcript_34482/g.86656 Transcript_34482/m.86656 type:complete len:371 (+) Transcript_34482:422-1534(+)